MEDVEHHVDEEEDEMFPLVEDQFSETALEKLGTLWKTRSKNL
jgi:hemerythrin-like domain-containing protein